MKIFNYLPGIYNILKKSSLLDPLTLLVGFRKGWADRDAIESYAESFLMKDNAPEAIELAMITGLHDHEIDEQLESWAGVNCFDEDVSGFLEKRRWLYAFLKTVYEVGNADGDGSELGFVLIDEVYAEFDYPNEMARCWRYYTPPEEHAGKERIDPWEELKRLIHKLEGEFDIESTEFS